MEAYSLRELRASRSTTQFSKAASLHEAKLRRLKTAFLCHSHKDRDEALGLKALIESQGGDLYIDWLDTEMPESPTRDTAERLKVRIAECDRFLLLATPNSMTSRWCPWELGLADGRKSLDSIAIIPTKDDGGRYYGNEYMQIYRRVEPSSLRTSSYQSAPPVVVSPGESYGRPMATL